MKLTEETAYFVELRAECIGALDAVGLRTQADRLRLLPPLTTRGAPVRWLCAFEAAQRAADDRRLFSVGSRCGLLAGALMGLLDFLLQDLQGGPEPGPEVDLEPVLRASLEAVEQRRKGTAA